MKRAGAVSVPGPLDAVSAAKPLDNTPHLFAVVGAKRDGPNGSHRRCDLQQMGADSFVVRCLKDNYHVVGTDGPVGLLQLHPVLLGHIGTTVGSGDGIPYVFDALVGVVHQTDISGHRASSFPSVSTKHQWCLQMKPDAPLLIHRESEKSSSRKLGFRQITFSETHTHLSVSPLPKPSDCWLASPGVLEISSAGAGERVRILNEPLVGNADGHCRPRRAAAAARAALTPSGPYREGLITSAFLATIAPKTSCFSGSGTLK